MGRDRNIAMGLGSNTNTTATITSCIRKVCFFEPYQIFFGIKEIVIGLMAYRIFSIASSFGEYV
jgi:hypothetical protein